jgi:WD40 repeat protein
MKYLILIFFIANFFIAMAKSGPEVVLTTGHNSQIDVMTVSADNKYLASAGNNKIIKIWDIASNREFRTISGMDGRVEQLAFSSNNISLVGTTGHGELIIWDVITGEIKFQTKCNSGFKGLSFYNKGTELLFLNENLNLSSLNLKTKVETILSKELSAISMVVDKVNNIAYVMGLKGEMVYFDLKSKLAIKSINVFDKVNFSYTTAKISKNGRYIVNTYSDNKIRVFDTKLEKFIYQSPKYKTKIMAFEMDAINPVIYFSIHTGEVIFFNYLKKEKIHSYKDNSFITSCITTYPEGSVLLVANYNVIRFINIDSKKEFKKFEPKINKVVNMAYDQQGNFLAVASDKINIQIWNLRQNKIVHTLDGFFPCEFSPDGKELITMAYSTNMAVWDVESWEMKEELSTESELIQEIAFSSDGKYVAGSGYQNTIKIWDRVSGKLIKKLKGHTAGILALDFHPTRPILASGSHDETVRIWDFIKEKELQQFTDQTVVVSGVKFSPDGLRLASSAWDKTIFIRKTSDWTIEHILKGHTNSIIGLDYNKNGSVIVSYAGNNSVSKADNSLMFWDTKTGNQIAKVQDHESGITKAFFDLDADYTFSSSDDGTIKITNYKKKKTIATFIAIGKTEFMIYTPENYYMASRNALDGIAFRINGELVPFEQFDIYLNRPDIVAKEIGKTSVNLINAYNYLYKKRLRKYDLDEGNINLDYHVPSLINESPVPLITASESIKITVKCWDDIYNLNQINIYVNGTPIYGESGFRIKEDIKSYRKTLEIPLLDGKNKIQISCLNSNGAESHMESFEVVKEKGDSKNNLYIVTIGVSNYKDDRFNLKYPTKDAKDMIDKLSQSKELYANVIPKILLDEEVTLENFIGLEKFFENCNHNDLAIIFIAGHGVLDANFDYFFGTHDIDFNEPSKRGLAYDRIHELLNKIKPYRKLLIMDTCHSGELDKEEIEEGPDPEVDDGDVKFRGGTVNIIQKNGFGSENTVELTKDLFSDTRKGSGAIVISSAGGAEYAMESDKWHNGLFTYSFLTGFETGKNIYGVDVINADFNKNGMVEVSEIRKFVNNNVDSISEGKQIPSSREDNISQDYTIFVK